MSFGYHKPKKRVPNKHDPVPNFPPTADAVSTCPPHLLVEGEPNQYACTKCGEKREIVTYWGGRQWTEEPWHIEWKKEKRNA